jgi:hypothetical protein
MQIFGDIVQTKCSTRPMQGREGRRFSLVEKNRAVKMKKIAVMVSFRIPPDQPVTRGFWVVSVIAI